MVCRMPYHSAVIPVFLLMTAIQQGCHHTQKYYEMFFVHNFMPVIYKNLAYKAKDLPLRLVKIRKIVKFTK
jgi:hypothetical protein